MPLLHLNGRAMRQTPVKSAPATGPRRLFILVDVHGWAFSHVATALQRHAPAGWHVEIDTKLPPRVGEWDVVYNLPNFRHQQIWERVQAVKPARPVLVGSFNTGWPFRSDRLPALVQHSDWILFNSFWSWDQAGRLPRTSYVPNGVDTMLFKPGRPILERRPTVLWCGSQFHAVHKGIELAEAARPHLEAMGLVCDFRVIDSYAPSMNHGQMAQWYNTGQYFLCASKSEGTPNTVLEAAACGCVIISTSVGNVPELIEHERNGIIIPRTVDGIVRGAWKAMQHPWTYSQAIIEDIQEWDWATRSQSHFSAFNALLEGRKPESLLGPHNLQEAA